MGQISELNISLDIMMMILDNYDAVQQLPIKLSQMIGCVNLFLTAQTLNLLG